MNYFCDGFERLKARYSENKAQKGVNSIQYNRKEPSIWSASNRLWIFLCLNIIGGLELSPNRKKRYYSSWHFMCLANLVVKSNLTTRVEIWARWNLFIKRGFLKNAFFVYWNHLQLLPLSYMTNSFFYDALLLVSVIIIVIIIIIIIFLYHHNNRHKWLSSKDY